MQGLGLGRVVAVQTLSVWLLLLSVQAIDPL